jgi:hypothetical protein
LWRITNEKARTPMRDNIIRPGKLGRVLRPYRASIAHHANIVRRGGVLDHNDAYAPS